MGLMCSWIAIQKAPKDAVLNHLGFVDTGREVEPGSGAAFLSCAERGDWLVIFSEDFDWADRDLVMDLSQFGLTVGCQFEDEVEMTSIAMGARGGEELWRVSHVNNAKDRLVVSGNPPAGFAAIRERLLMKQSNAGGYEADVDYLHDIPLDVAKAACGYRLDQDEEPFFMRLERQNAPTRERASGKPGLFGQLLAPLFGKRT